MKAFKGIDVKSNANVLNITSDKLDNLKNINDDILLSSVVATFEIDVSLNQNDLNDVANLNFGTGATAITNLDDINSGQITFANNQVTITNTLLFNSGGVKWDDVLEKPALSVEGHTHDDRYYTETEIDTNIYTKTNLQTDGQASVHYNNLTSVPSSFSPIAHSHDNLYYTESETDSLLSGKSDTGHTHDDRYYTETELSTSGGGSAVHWDNITSAPTTFEPGEHNHDDRYYTESETDSLLSGKSDTGHDHDATYLKLTGGTLSGNLNMGENGITNVVCINNLIEFGTSVVTVGADFDMSTNNIYNLGTNQHNLESNLDNIKDTYQGKPLGKANVVADGISDDVSTEMAGESAGGGEGAAGVVTDVAHNRVIIQDEAGDDILDGQGNKVYGRLTENAGTWTLSYYSNIAGTETVYDFTSTLTIQWFVQKVYHLYDLPVYDPMFAVGSDQVAAEVPNATTSVAGKVLLAVDGSSSSGKVVQADDSRLLTSIQKTDLTDSGDTTLHTHDGRYYTETELNTSGGGGSVHWDNIASAPTTFEPGEHNHDDRYYTETEIDTNIYTKTNLQTDGQASVHYNNLTSVPSSFSPIAHSHNDLYYTESETDSLLSGKSDTGHIHDDRYYTETELSTSGGGSAVHWDNITSAPTTFEPGEHNHDDRYYTETEIDTNIYTKTNLQTDGQASVHYNNLTSVPASFSPIAHSHDDLYYTESEIDSTLTGYLALSGGTMTGDIAMSDNQITGIGTMSIGSAGIRYNDATTNLEISHDNTDWYTAAGRYEHVQSSAAVEWTFTHNLNHSVVSVQVYELSGGVYRQVIPAEITLLASKNVCISFGDVSTAGTAIVV